MMVAHDCCIIAWTNFSCTSLLLQALTDVDSLSSELSSAQSASSLTPDLLMSLTERLSAVTTPALREGHLLLDRVGRDDRGAHGVTGTLKELEARYKSFDNQLRQEIGKISEKSEAYHQFRETYSFVSLETSELNLMFYLVMAIEGSFQGL